MTLSGPWKTSPSKSSASSVAVAPARLPPENPLAHYNTDHQMGGDSYALVPSLKSAPASIPRWPAARTPSSAAQSSAWARTRSQANLMKLSLSPSSRNLSTSPRSTIRAQRMRAWHLPWELTWSRKSCWSTRCWLSEMPLSEEVPWQDARRRQNRPQDRLRAMRRLT
jgi:hypothetical protein